ncbi:MAG: hypothetical protein Q4A55_01685 [Aerococcus sp.]|nr:hypothetical protein [Aerococcus sp.]
MQRKIESRGIRTAAMIHLTNVIKKVRPPRVMVTPYPLGQTFSEEPHDRRMQTEAVKKLLALAVNGGKEEVVKWK